MAGAGLWAGRSLAARGCSDAAVRDARSAPPVQRATDAARRGQEREADVTPVPPFHALWEIQRADTRGGRIRPMGKPEPRPVRGRFAAAPGL